MRALVFTLFLLSGACGLVYEVVWSRVLTQIFGSTVLAVGTILAAFMSGLALGAYLLGRRGDRSANPLRLYAYLEFGIGFAALGATLLMHRVDSLNLWMHGAFGESVVLLSGVRFIVTFALVMVPTILMGATLPILSRFVIRQLSAVGSNLSSLYAINTVGAVAGSLAAGFYLIRTLGIHRSVYVAVAFNLAIAVVAWIASGRFAGAAPPAAQVGSELAPEEAGGAAGSGVGPVLLLWAFGLSGFTSFAYEIFWTRSLVHLLGNSTYAFTMMLTAFLSGIALGGYLVRFVVDRLPDRAKGFAWLQILIGITAGAALPVLFSIVYSETMREFLKGTANELGVLMLSRFVTALLVMLVPATLIGATFPLVGRIFVRDLRRTGADVGRIYAVNTVGNVLGALAPGFVLLPIFGIQKGVVLLAALNLSIGVFILLAGQSRTAALRFAVPLAFAAVAVLLTSVEFDFQFPAERQGPDDRVLYYREGLSGTTKVFEVPRTGAKRMSIDGIIIGGTEFTDYKQQVLAHLPKLLLKEYDSELSVGLGSGILIGESLRHRRLQRIVCIEIEPSVIEGAGEFAEESYHVLDDPRARIVMDDAGNFLRTTSEKYDIISADEKTADKYASNGFSYSADYYDLLKEHLKPGGLATQWIPNHLPPSQFRMVLKTFAHAFPHTTFWYFPSVGKGGPTNTFVIGSLQAIEIDPAWINATLDDRAEAFHGIRKYGLDTAESILAHYVADGAAVREATRDAVENTLEHPYYEFYSPREYSVPVNPRIHDSHGLLTGLRSKNGLTQLAGSLAGPVTAKLRQAFEAEDLYLAGLNVQLEGRPYAEVSGHYDASIELAPWNDNLRLQILSYYWNEAGVLYLQGNHRDALFFMGRAVEAYPGDGEVRYYLGLALLQTGDRDRALEEMREAVALDPRLTAPRQVLASQYLATRAHDEAATQLEAVLESDPEDLYALVTYGTFLAEHRSNHDAAEAYLARAHGLAPQDAAVIDGLAWLAYLRGDLATARRTVQDGGSYYQNEPLFEQRRQIILQRAQ